MAFASVQAFASLVCLVSSYNKLEISQYLSSM